MLHVSVLVNLYNKQKAAYDYAVQYSGTKSDVSKAAYKALAAITYETIKECSNYTAGKWMLNMGFPSIAVATLLSKIDIEKIQSPAQLLSYAGLASHKTPYCKEVRGVMIYIGDEFASNTKCDIYYDMLHDKYEQLCELNPDTEPNKLMFKAKVHTEKQFLIDLYNMMKELKDAEVTC